MRLYKLVISCVFLGLSLAIIGQSLWISFTPVPATVIESHRVTVPSSSPYRPDRDHYTFTYEYTYGDQRHRSNRHSYFGKNNSTSVCNHLVGDTITAYVNQRDPAYAVTKPQVSGIIYAIAILGSLMVIHSILDYIPALEHQPWLQRLYARLGTGIGATLFFGSLAYLCYVMVVVARQTCLN